MLQFDCKIRPDFVDFYGNIFPNIFTEVLEEDDGVIIRVQKKSKIQFNTEPKNDLNYNQTDIELNYRDDYYLLMVNNGYTIIKVEEIKKNINCRTIILTDENSTPIS